MSDNTMLCIVAYWSAATAHAAAIMAVYGAYPKSRDMTWGQLLLLLILLPGYLTIELCDLFIAILVTVWDHLNKPVRKR